MPEVCLLRGGVKVIGVVPGINDNIGDPGDGLKRSGLDFWVTLISNNRQLSGIEWNSKTSVYPDVKRCSQASNRYELGPCGLDDKLPRRTWGETGH